MLDIKQQTPGAGNDPWQPQVREAQQNAHKTIPTINLNMVSHGHIRHAYILVG